ncbi:MAG: metallophosphoesterase [Jaaginema sp. PMC 1079.18]|nr:metallophosphoesterase [Jaaginema sp. PMC 1080.18]MEC4850860.1 metallophosphoesterase [Jaaginema sp. PMC 1079.18]MEC4866268.1 metallophosphoesterase [Jaaginema sp. PMC 1078.18]
MKFTYDSSIAHKIQKMKQRVCWQSSTMVERNIDQTRLVIDDRDRDNPEFSFLVLGDSGTGYHRGHRPQREIAKLLWQNRQGAKFVLHTGDVVYLVGSSEYYPENFIEPYREFIVGGDRPKTITYDKMTFNLPFFPVPGNHDYYDLPLIYGILSQATWLLRRLLRTKIDLDVGWHGSHQGEAYAKAFIDYLQDISTPDALGRHLDKHYNAKTSTGNCLHYQAGKFTRIPNRYYTFRYGGIDFFALDSNTFNTPSPIPDNAEGDRLRRQLVERLQTLQAKKQAIIAASKALDSNDPDDCEELDDNNARLEQIEEIEIDIEKRLQSNLDSTTDYEQLHWLQERLIASWGDRDARGRVIFFHHPPYVTEATKWDQAQTLEIRAALRRVFESVVETVGDLIQNRSVVDLVINGHAHCLEHLQTEDSDRADANIDWIICGGSGYSLRRQRPEGDDIVETDPEGQSRITARSRFFLGRYGRGKDKRRPYSALRIDVQPGDIPQFQVTPLIAERGRSTWHYPQLKSWILGDAQTTS